MLSIDAAELRLLDSLSLGLILTDTQGIITSMNSVAEAVYGYTAQEVLGRDLRDVVNLKYGDERRADAFGVLATTGVVSTDSVPDRPDGTAVLIEGGIMPLQEAGGPVTGYVYVFRDITQRALPEGVAERKRAEQARQQLLGRLVTAQEEERSRLARELHDQLGQQVVALKLALQPLLRPPDARPYDAAAAADVLAQVDELAHAVRTLAWELRPPALDDLGVREAIVSYVEDWPGQDRVAVDLHLDDLGARMLPAAVELALYRVVQEALTNVLKHAQARTVSIIFEQHRRAPTYVRLIVEDDGQGFDVAAVEGGLAEGGLGLRGMQERITQVAGTLEIESAPGVGTTLFVRIPLPPTPPPAEEDIADAGA